MKIFLEITSVEPSNMINHLMSMSQIYQLCQTHSELFHNNA